MRIAILLAIALAPAAASAVERPNIIFMLADDQGWGGTSVAMHPSVAFSKGSVFQTPNLEKLASQGMRFSAAYAPAPVCSPTRISIQTGKSPAQLHWTKAAPPVEGHQLTEPRLIKSIPSEEQTIGELLRKAGYATAHYGKWHIAGGGPESNGYDESDGDTGNENAYQFVDPNPVDIFGMAERAELFMAKSAKAGKPFYIQMSWNALHASENALQATLAKYERLAQGDNAKRATVAAITEDLDTGVGRLMASINRLGLTDKTYLFYMSDNGAGGGGGGSKGGGGKAGGGGGLNGGKGDVWEGGIRVPLIVRGPGVKPNSWCHTRVVGYDLLPTFCQWAGVPTKLLPREVEGGSIAELLTHDGKGEVHRPREELVFHFPHYQGLGGPQSAIYVGDLKLMHFYEDDRDALFDLSKDIGERSDLASKMPAEAARMRKQLDAYLAAVDAQFATPNSNFDPSKPLPPTKNGGDKKTNPKKTPGGMKKPGGNNGKKAKASS
ncbi:MAG: sulfatase [Pirellula sp.]|nr:sulfatase [Pirellula sp.]